MAAEDPTVPLDTLLAEAAWLRALAQSLVRDPGTADDVVQETWLAALRRPPLSGRPLRPWLRAVAENVVRMRRRGEGARTAREQTRAKPDPGASEVELVDRVEEQRFLAREVLMLEEPYRTTVVLRYYEGLTSEQIGQRTNSNENTVRWRLKRGLEQLRERLDRRHGGDRGRWMALLAPLSGPWLAPNAASTGATATSSSGMLVALALGVAGVLLGVLGWFVAGPESATPAGGAGALSASVEEAAADLTGETSQRATVDPATSALRSGRATARLRGRAVDRSSRSVSGAHVSLVLDDALLADTLSARDGVFELAYDDTRSEPRIGEVLVRASGYLDARARAPLEMESALELGDVRLVPEARIEGRVLDGNARAMVGAEVLVERIGSRWAGVREAPLEEARRLGSLLGDDAPRAQCDDGGRFEIGGLEECFARLWVRAEGFETQWTEPVALFAGKTTQAPTVTLEPIDSARALSGRVLDDAGVAVAGARVQAARTSLGRPFFAGRFGVTETTTDGEGRFSLPLEAGARYDLAVRAEAGVALETSLVPATDERIVRLRRSVPWSVECSRAFVLEGADLSLELTARDAQSGAVLARSTASLGDATSSVSVEAWRPFVIEARSREYAGRSVPVDPAQAPSTILVSLERMTALVVRVTDRGAPSADATIEVLDASQPPRSWSEPVLFGEPLRLSVDDPAVVRARIAASPDGSAVVRALEGESIALRVRAPGRASVLIEPFAARDGALDLELSDGGVLEGVVERFDTTFVAGTCVAVSRGDGIAQHQLVGADGAYRFAGLAAGAWQVRVIDPRAIGRLPASGARAERVAELVGDARVEDGATTRFDLSVGAPPRCTLFGELTLDGVAPGAWVAELLRRGKPRVLARAYLDPSGRFELGLESSGDFELRVDSVGHGGARYELRENVVLVEGKTRFSWAERAATVRVRAAGVAAGVGVVARCETSTGGSLDVSAALDRDGCVELSVLASAVVVELDDGSSTPITLRLRPGERRDVRLDAR